ncbi:TPA: bifunctional folylpolyglutamate synthase/dihydrofolate synthase [Streptococcus pyogenes]|uniref:folylpolyglutamate synthase/dihydrofolate synthase family protein n=1 Tax=Streptococcus pyogenes TaxID=1314 RepID=UPI00109D27B0|nr:folylpolyglutamate synthase/dihydrofolate synthase family protein [Streptococcus pyogenes]QCK43958.1 bifunctional folylpolyglutamate synthase/dihydrofolate synthase [Streptococcus pyogenes]VHF48168.1 folylpolyglutamate synthase / dihydrofolate synthase [Streptococcus pyogenes]VHG35814.1 folylpolyglutamate synthase / dihydrofolate synthase [Streptococcus pyogenes]VHK09443.1 folylpolyglutamate synthase/dihydrofolate synthase [Streptococcus pyogenes]VHL93969.1 folylpolyglutamate synthase/dihyd
MTYEETLEWIHDHLVFGIKPGLKRMLWVLGQLGNPQKNVKGVHIVGTNGKGSTVNHLQHIFTTAGYEVGTFTSPYIMDFKERISINGRMISEKDLVIAANRIRPLTERLVQETDFGEVTEFEVITLIMFLYFGDMHLVDIAIIEAGLGGLYDSTNVFQAMVVVCPSIGLDHQAILGETYADIAAQKAGVLEGGETLVFAVENPSAREVFLTKAEQVGASIWEWQEQFQMAENASGYRFTSPLGVISDIHIAMPGHHQVSNAALAIMTCLTLQDRYPRLTPDHIREGLANSLWLGRTELLAPNLMIDGAHNNESVAALVAVLKNNYNDKKLHILFGAIDTKPIVDMLVALEQIGDLQVTSFHYPNAYPLEKYPERFGRVADFKDFLALRKHAKADDFFVITGSLYFISEIRRYWKKHIEKNVLLTH